jgi:hypothetical protein
VGGSGPHGVALRSDRPKDRNVPSTRYIAAFSVALVSVDVQAATPPRSSVSLTQAPLVIRINKDEFRVAFGVDGEQCFPIGCHGSIRYRVTWRTEDGLTRSESRQVSYAVFPNSRRSITVDRQYFDTAEGEHTTQVVSVSVEMITCERSVGSRAL